MTLTIKILLKKQTFFFFLFLVSVFSPMLCTFAVLSKKRKLYRDLFLELKTVNGFSLNAYLGTLINIFTVGLIV